MAHIPTIMSETSNAGRGKGDDAARGSLMTMWPPLSLAAWKDTYATLHMWTQIVGKTRLAFAPMENHWWQVALYVTPRGLTTSAMPSGGRTFAVDFDFIDHELSARTSDGAAEGFQLQPCSVADFFAQYTDALRALDIVPRLRPSPVEVEVAIPFAEDRQHASYDRDAVHRWWQALVQVDRVFKRFRGRFLGKSSPAHFFWGSFDHALTRFSGRHAPTHAGGAPHCPDYVMVEAYSRECCSCGFWPGSGAIEDAAFYAYAYPEPARYPRAQVRPDGAYYSTAMHEFVLPYDVVRRAADPDATILEFMQTTYDAAATLGRWQRADLDRPQAEWP